MAKRLIRASKVKVGDRIHFVDKNLVSTSATVRKIATTEDGWLAFHIDGQRLPLRTPHASVWVG